MAASAHCVGFCQGKAFTFRIVGFVNSDQGGNTETTHVFSAHFRPWALRRHHDDGEVVADLHAFFDDVKTVRVRQASAFFHQRHYRRYNSGVLLIGRQVQDHICRGDQLFVGTDSKAVFSGVLPRLALLFDGFRAQGVRDVQAAIA